MIQCTFIAVFLFLMFISDGNPKPTPTSKKINYATEIKKTKEREIALAKQRAWKQKGGSV